jgi:hypothetical protein
MALQNGNPAVRGFPAYEGTGTPEAAQYGSVGQSYVDITTGYLYWKTTADSLNTGWQLAGGGIVGQTVSGDITFTGDPGGPVLTDETDGHTYRIISTAGVLTTEQVT